MHQNMQQVPRNATGDARTTLLEFAGTCKLCWLSLLSNPKAKHIHENSILVDVGFGATI